MDDNLMVDSLGDPVDGSITSCASGEAVRLYSDSAISGHMRLTDPGGSILRGADLAVGGEVQVGVDEPEFPTFDVSTLTPLATNIVDASTDVEVSKTWRNIRIKAGTNPVFDEADLEGVIYVESPNVVTFRSDVNLTGAIITEDPGEGADPSKNRIIFENIALHEPSTLPDVSVYAPLRQLTGSYFIAPGFNLYTKGNITGPVGVMAAGSIVCDNRMSGTLYGMITAFGAGGIVFHDDCDVTVDRAGWESGGIAKTRIEARPATYAEVIGP
jgi:hypothetical protein